MTCIYKKAIYNFYRSSAGTRIPNKASPREHQKGNLQQEKNAMDDG